MKHKIPFINVIYVLIVMYCLYFYLSMICIDTRWFLEYGGGGISAVIYGSVDFSGELETSTFIFDRHFPVV